MSQNPDRMTPYDATQQRGAESLPATIEAPILSPSDNKLGSSNSGSSRNEKDLPTYTAHDPSGRAREGQGLALSNPYPQGSQLRDGLGAEVHHPERARLATDGNNPYGAQVHSEKDFACAFTENPNGKPIVAMSFGPNGPSPETRKFIKDNQDQYRFVVIDHNSAEQAKRVGMESQDFWRLQALMQGPGQGSPDITTTPNLAGIFDPKAREMRPTASAKIDGNFDLAKFLGHESKEGSVKAQVKEQAKEPVKEAEKKEPVRDATKKEAPGDATRETVNEAGRSPTKETIHGAAKEPVAKGGPKDQAGENPSATKDPLSVLPGFDALKKLPGTGTASIFGESGAPKNDRLTNLLKDRATQASAEIVVTGNGSIDINSLREFEGPVRQSGFKLGASNSDAIKSGSKNTKDLVKEVTTAEELEQAIKGANDKPLVLFRPTANCTGDSCSMPQGLSEQKLQELKGKAVVVQLPQHPLDNPRHSPDISAINQRFNELSQDHKHMQVDLFSVKNGKLSSDTSPLQKHSAEGSLGSDNKTSAKTGADKPVADKAPTADKVAGGKDSVAADKATADKATADKATADKATVDKAAADKATADKATADKAAADKTTADKAAADKAAADQGDATKPSPTTFWHGPQGAKHIRLKDLSLDFVPMQSTKTGSDSKNSDAMIHRLHDENGAAKSALYVPTGKLKDGVQRYETYRVSEQQANNFCADPSSLANFIKASKAAGSQPGSWVGHVGIDEINGKGVYTRQLPGREAEFSGSTPLTPEEKQEARQRAEQSVRDSHPDPTKSEIPQGYEDWQKMKLNFDGSKPGQAETAFKLAQETGMKVIVVQSDRQNCPPCRSLHSRLDPMIENGGLAGQAIVLELPVNIHGTSKIADGLAKQLYNPGSVPQLNLFEAGKDGQVRNVPLNGNNGGRLDPALTWIRQHPTESER